MGMTYYESAEGITITKARARHEVVKDLNEHVHEEYWGRFLADMGDHETYDAQAVLDWMGF